MWTLELPLKIQVSKNKSKSLNLNEYRNWHYQLSNKVKQQFKDDLNYLVGSIPYQQRIHLHYTFYPVSKRKQDVMNVVAVADKFFSDVLPEIGVILDDNYHHLPSVSANYGGVDKINPRIEVTIIPWADPHGLSLELVKNAKRQYYPGPSGYSYGHGEVLSSSYRTPEWRI